MKKKPNFLFNLVGLESMTVLVLGHMYLGSDANSCLNRELSISTKCRFANKCVSNLSD